MANRHDLVCEKLIKKTSTKIGAEEAVEAAITHYWSSSITPKCKKRDLASPIGSLLSSLLSLQEEDFLLSQQ